MSSTGSDSSDDEGDEQAPHRQVHNIIQRPMAQPDRAATDASTIDLINQAFVKGAYFGRGSDFTQEELASHLDISLKTVRKYKVDTHSIYHLSRRGSMPASDPRLQRRILRSALDSSKGHKTIAAVTHEFEGEATPSYVRKILMRARNNGELAYNKLHTRPFLSSISKDRRLLYARFDAENMNFQRILYSDEKAFS